MLTFDVFKNELFGAAGDEGVFVVDWSSGEVTRTLRSMWKSQFDPIYVRAWEPRGIERIDPSYMERCIDARAIAVICSESRIELAVMGFVRSYDVMTPAAQLFRLSPTDGVDLRPPVEAHCYGLTHGAYRGQPALFLADSRTIHIVDLHSGEVRQEDVGWSKAFDVACDDLLYVASHGSGSGDCVFALDPQVPGFGRALATTPDEALQGGLVAGRNELFIADGTDIAVLERRSLRGKRRLTVPGYQNGPLAVHESGLFVRLGEFGGTNCPPVRDQSRFAVVSFESGAILHEFEVHF